MLRCYCAQGTEVKSDQVGTQDERVCPLLVTNASGNAIASLRRTRYTHGRSDTDVHMGAIAKCMVLAIATAERYS